MIFLLLENVVHKKSGCSKTTLIFFNKIFALSSALLMQDLIALDAFDILITTSLWIPSDVVIDVDNISVLLLLILKMTHLILRFPNSIIPIGSLKFITLLLSYHLSLNQ